MESVNGRWTGLVVGAWVLISPWLLGFASISIAKWSNLIAGLIIVIVNAWMIFGEPAAKPAPDEKNKK